MANPRQPIVDAQGNNLIVNDLLRSCIIDVDTVGYVYNTLVSHGWGEYCRALYAPHQHDNPISPRVVQSWIRYFMSFEQGHIVAWMLRTGHGTSWREHRPEQTIVPWTPLWTRPTANDQAEQPLVYLAGPYSRAEDKEDLMRRVMTVSGKWMIKNPGHHVVSPMFNHYSLEHVPEMGGDYNFWGDYSRNLLKRCNLMLLAKFPGWEQSTGVADEIKTANENNIPIIEVIPAQFGC